MVQHRGFFPLDIDLMIKEAIHIQTTSMERLINRDKGAEIPGCWVATISALAQKYMVFG